MFLIASYKITPASSVIAAFVVLALVVVSSKSSSLNNAEEPLVSFLLRRFDTFGDPARLKTVFCCVCTWLDATSPSVLTTALPSTVPAVAVVVVVVSVVSSVVSSVR